MKSSHILLRWKGKNQFGEILKGESKALSVNSLILMLKQQGVISYKIKPVYSGFCLGLRKYIKPKKTEVARVIEQLSMLLSAHIPLIPAIETIQHNLSPAMKPIMEDCLLQVKSGHSLSLALTGHNRCFNSFLCRWIAAGEHSGTLETLLVYWVSYQEKNEQLQQKIKKALIYPIFILFTTAIISIILFVSVLPVFEQLFTQVNADLPSATKAAMDIAQFMVHIGLPMAIFLMVGIGLGWVIRRYGPRSFPQWAYLWDNMILRMPVTGKIIQQISIARLARIVSVMLSAGFPLAEALKWASETMNNEVLAKMVTELREAIISGVSLNHAMSMLLASKFIPLLLKQMTAVGEISGTLDKNLAKVADFYEQKIFHRIENMSQLAEPVVMTILGVLIGGFILVMYLPIFQLGALF